MVEVTNTPLYSAQSVNKTQATTSDSKAVLSSDFETFLKMLTVQVQNQDPLNPVDSTEYATQLATFSSVEQQVLTNDLLRGMASTLSGNALSEVGRWIGMEGLVRAPVAFSGDPITIRPDYTLGSDAAQLVVRNASGMEVQRFDIDLGEETVLWGGYDSSGNMLATGNYRFDVESYKDDKLVSSTMAQVYSRIDEVRNDDGTIMVRMSDGSEFGSDQIGGLRAPRS